MSTPYVTVEVKKNEGVYVYFRGVLHAHWYRKHYRGFTAWIDHEQRRYCCAVMLAGGAEVLMEYDNPDLWDQVIHAVHDVL